MKNLQICSIKRNIGFQKCNTCCGTNRSWNGCFDWFGCILLTQCWHARVCNESAFSNYSVQWVKNQKVTVTYASIIRYSSGKKHVEGFPEQFLNCLQCLRRYVGKHVAPYFDLGGKMVFTFPFLCMLNAILYIHSKSLVNISNMEVGR